MRTGRVLLPSLHCPQGGVWAATSELGEGEAHSLVGAGKAFGATLHR